MHPVSSSPWEDRVGGFERRARRRYSPDGGALSCSYAAQVLREAAPEIRQRAATRRFDRETGLAIDAGQHADAAAGTGVRGAAQGRFRRAGDVFGDHMARLGWSE